MGMLGVAVRASRTWAATSVGEGMGLARPGGQAGRERFTARTMIGPSRSAVISPDRAAWLPSTTTPEAPIRSTVRVRPGKPPSRAWLLARLTAVMPAAASCSAASGRAHRRGRSWLPAEMQRPRVGLTRFGGRFRYAAALFTECISSNSMGLV